MEIQYKNKKLEKVCTSAHEAEKAYGRDMAVKIQQRIDQIMAAESVEMMLRFHIGRCHKLGGDRKGMYAVDLAQPYRLVFRQIGMEVQVALITEIVDYH